MFDIVDEGQRGQDPATLGLASMSTCLSFMFYLRIVGRRNSKLEPPWSWPVLTWPPKSPTEGQLSHQWPAKTLTTSASGPVDCHSVCSGRSYCDKAKMSIYVFTGLLRSSIISYFQLSNYQSNLICSYIL